MGKIIGVDPAFRKKGMAVAVIDTENKTVYAKQMNGVIEFYLFISLLDKDDVESIIIEDASLQNVTFLKSKNPNVAARLSRNVGMVQAVSAQIVQVAEEKFGEEKVYAISPKEKGTKIYDHALFCAYLRSVGLVFIGNKSSQDVRDAVKIASIGLNANFLNILKNKRLQK